MAVFIDRHFNPDGLYLIQGHRQLEAIFKIDCCLGKAHALDHLLKIFRTVIAVTL